MSGKYKSESIVTFGEVVRNVDESVRDPQTSGLERYVGLEHIDPETLHIERWGLISEGTSFTRRFRKGQVLFGKRRAYQRKVAVAEFDGLCSSDILVFEPKDDRLLPEILPFLCQTDGFFEHALNTSAGSLSPRTKFKDLAQYEFLLPPLEEQRRTAEVLWAADKATEKFSGVLHHANSLQTTFVSEFLGEGFYSSESVFSPDSLIPKTWSCIKVGDLLKESPKNGLSPSTSGNSAGYPTLSISAIRNGKVIPEGNTKYAIISDADLNKFRLERNDILVVRGNGNKQLTGKCGIVEKFPDNCFYPDLLIRLRFDEKVIRPEFACIQWNSRNTHRRLIAKAKSTNGIGR